MATKELQLTSVKVHRHLFEEFKIECVRTKFSLQKLTDRALYLYLTDEDGGYSRFFYLPGQIPSTGVPIRSSAI